VSDRELVVLGTASQAPTRHRNHNGYFLRWDAEGILFDPGEGIQRQCTFAGVSAGSVTRICVTHFHGDHSLGLPGMIMRVANDGGRLPLRVHYPASGEEHFERLRYATIGQELVGVEALPVAVSDAGLVEIHRDDELTVSATRLNHRVDAIGYRIAELDGRRMLVDRLHAAGVVGPAVGHVQREGRIDVDGRTVLLDDVSELRRGQVFAFVMDTAWCEGAVELAVGADLLVCESTFLQPEAELAARYGHLTARQAGRLAAEAGVRRLVLTHFSARYDSPQAFADEAAIEYAGDIVVAADLMRIPVPART
jgi:ribonuclease Z